VQGYPVQAVEQARRTLNDAKLSGNSRSLAVALSWIPSIFILVGDYRSAEHLVDGLIPHAASHSLPPYLHVGLAYKAILAIYGGKPKAGVQALQDCMKHLHAVHYEMRSTEFNIFLTQGFVAMGRADEGLALIDETIRRVEETEERCFLPEVLRMKGLSLLASQGSRVDEAEACFTQSLEWSRRQGARGWELRTAIDLARLWADRGKPEDARVRLQPILKQFTEGQDTADLQTAGRLLAELAKITKSGERPRRR